MVQKAEKGKGNPRTEQHKTEKKEKEKKEKKEIREKEKRKDSYGLHLCFPIG